MASKKVREIKFRGLRGAANWEEKEWVYGHLVGVSDNGIAVLEYRVCMIPLDSPEDEVCREVRRAEVYANTVGHYTGQKDVNDKEIYEEDILLSESGFRFRVEFSDGSFNYVNDSAKYLLTELDINKYNLTIDGNVHE